LARLTPPKGGGDTPWTKSSKKNKSKTTKRIKSIENLIKEKKLDEPAKVSSPRIIPNQSLERS